MTETAASGETQRLTVVVDASVWVSRLVPSDAHHQASRRWLEAFTERGGHVVAPVLLLPEIAGAVSRHTSSPDLARQAVQILQRLRSLRLVALDRALGLATSRLAADLGLRGTDATYVAVADVLKIPLITWDSEHVDKAGKRVIVQMPDVH